MAKLSLDESEPACIPHPGLFLHLWQRQESQLTYSAQKDQNLSILKNKSPLSCGYFEVMGLGVFFQSGYSCYLTVVYIFCTIWHFHFSPSFVPPRRPNQLHLLFAQMSTTARVTMMMSPCQAWPSPLRLKTSSMSKRWAADLMFNTVVQRGNKDDDQEKREDAQDNCL